MMSELSPGGMLLECIAYRFGSLKELGERAIAQLSDEDLTHTVGEESNSIAVLLKHLHGNMMSRWTDFLTSDGEKPWRDRDGEFEPDAPGRPELMKLWEEGWDCLFDALAALSPEDLGKRVMIRGRELSVLDSLLRQFGHYASHVGQMVFIAKYIRGREWKTLSIACGESKSYMPGRRD
jgi:hypothetical protein